MVKKKLPANVTLLVGGMWAVFIIEVLLPGISFEHFGIYPRSVKGLLGIVVSPFLHGGLFHLLYNTFALVVLSLIVHMSLGAQRLQSIIILGVAGSGLGTWLFSTGGPVIGASGLVYALIGYLLADAYFSPSLRSWGVALLAFFLYGGALKALFIFIPYISWSAHFWGLISGITIARLMKKGVLS
jgi:membrane associated rhomboid family serine protease